MRPARRAVAVLLAGAFLGGCATAREAGRIPADGEAGGVRVAVYADDDARASGTILEQPIVGVLERRDGRQWQALFHSIDAAWTVAGLAPGRYRVRFDAALDETGEPAALERPLSEEFELEADEIVEIEVLLDHVSPAMVAAGAAAVVVAAVLLHEWLDGLDLPSPPPPPAWAIEAAFWVTLDLASEPAVWVPHDRSPRVTSHFPEDGDVVAARRVRVVFSLAEPIDPERLATDAIVVETGAGDVVPGQVTWDSRRWWLAWEPSHDLPRATRLRATLRMSAEADTALPALDVQHTIEFSTAR